LELKVLEVVDGVVQHGCFVRLHVHNKEAPRSASSNAAENGGRTGV
jgi:hypothetical protein